MLLTQAEKQSAWDRLKHGRAILHDSMLCHTMLVARQNVKSAEEINPLLAQQFRAAYRMVRRGVITTTPQFNRIAKAILEQGK